MSYPTGIGRGRNPCKVQNYSQIIKENSKKCQNDGGPSEDKFRTAQQKIQANIEKHLEQGYESSSSEEEVEYEPILNSVFKGYSELNGNLEGLEKIHKFLENTFQSGTGVCLICIASVKRIDPIWSCTKCYAFFHLNCIQKWSRDNIFQQKQIQEDLPVFQRSDIIFWGCPKCRQKYQPSDIPQKSFCFCGKVQDPPYQPFLVPHSCGEICNRSLQPECGHFCLLLCHPGPCPPCPKTVQVKCHCKKQGPILQRCSNKNWSCNLKCGKPLLCGKHFCEESCHMDDCVPCTRESIQKCICGLEKRKQPCTTPIWQCEKICGKPYACGFHTCCVKCHAGSCGSCPGSLQRTCPCGKSELQLPCTQEIPACNETCGKLLDCNFHYCSQKCHKGKCGKCLEVVVKTCRCGLHKKELPCQKEYLCETKCKRLKNCLRHSCNRKCCNMICPPCEKPCGRTLSCRNHKCPSVCHRGPCYPCPQVVDVKCRCGKTVISVACGREKKVKPPRCSKLCLIPPNCHHSSREDHRCHFGECPPCEQICGKDRKNCSHRCSATCHSAVWQKINENPCPTGPWEAVQFQYKRCSLPCPDCQVPVPVTCLGGHETRDQPCFKAQPTSCLRTCGRLLECENHKCEKLCHVVTGAGDSLLAGENCSECEFDCLKERPKGCSHRCPNPCHPGECPPCSVKLKIKCHCSVSFLYINCSDYLNADDVGRENLLACGNKCPKNYSCGHRCRSNCHSGDCPQSEICKKKIKLSCECKRIKKDFPCYMVRSENLKILTCDELCLTKFDEEKKAKNLEIEQKKLDEERRNREEVEKFEKKFQGKKKSRDRAQLNNDENTNSFMNGYCFSESTFIVKYWYIVLGTVAASIAAYCVLRK